MKAVLADKVAPPKREFPFPPSAVRSRVAAAMVVAWVKKLEVDVAGGKVFNVDAVCRVGPSPTANV